MAKASAYLVGSGEDGHEATQHGSTDAGDVDKRALTVTDRNRGVTVCTQTETAVCKTGGLK